MFNSSDVSLASYLKDLGYGSTYTSNVIFAVLEQLSIYPSNAYSKISESEVGKTLAMMVSVPTGLEENPALKTLASGILNEAESDQMSKMKTWNAELFFPLIMQMNPSMDWSNVLRYLDQPDVIFVDPTSLAIVLKASKAVIQDMSLFPTAIFLEKWNYPNAQLSFLNQAIRLTPEIFTLNQGIVRKVIQLDVQSRNSLITSLVNAASASPWNSLDLIQLLASLSEGTFASIVREMLEFGVQQSADIVLLGISQIQTDKVSIKKLGAGLVRLLILGHPHSPIILPRVWQLAPDLFISGLILLYSEDHTSISRILDIAQELKALSIILESGPFSFSIDLAALASRREYLNLEKWLNDHIKEHGDLFYRACLDFLSEKLSMLGRSDTVPTSLSIDVTKVFLRTLHENSKSSSPENVEYLRKILAVCSQMFPTGGTQEETENSVVFSPELEKEALIHYERLYKGELTIPRVIELLNQFKNSSNAHEQDMFKCMIQYLFDEYKYFPRYPERQLLITAVLFGSLIQNQVVSSMALGIALRYVLEALRQVPGSLLFKFGLHALAQFQSRLSEWPQYCSLLLQIEHLHHSCPDVIQFIKNLPGQGVAVNRESNEAPPSLFKALNLTGLIRNGMFSSKEAPPESIRDKILFAINNLSFSNLDSKSAEVLDLIRPQYYRWFSHYIVVNRASQEPNFHSLYLAFVSSLKLEQLDSIILYETLSEIRELLNSEKTLTSSQERSLLKNLGTWLGSVTLAKNIPIKHQNLSFKDLLLEGYDLKRLIVVIPFVCKVLEQCNSSKVFTPPNPWLMAVLSLLIELYHYAELKLNLKFEVEVLCKNIKVDINSVAPSEILRVRGASKEQAPAPASKSTPTMASKSDDSLSNLGAYIVYNPSITLFQSRPALKRIVHVSVERSIREVIQSPVVERSVTIAVITTREIILKDFALEPNEEKMRLCAHHMVKALAGSLASVSSREPLRVSMIANLRNLFLQNGLNEQAAPEQMIYLIVNDNIDLACSFMEKAAAEKSMAEVDESLAQNYLARKKHRERSNQPYYDMSVYGASRYPSILPDMIRLRPGGLAPAQLSVYEEFSAPVRRIPRETSSVQDSESATVPEEQQPLTMPKIVESFSLLMTELDQILDQNLSSKLATLSTHPQIQQIVKQIIWLVTKSSHPDDTVLVFTQKMVQLLYQNDKEINELYIWLLVKLIDSSPRTLRDFKDWLLYEDDSRKLNVPVFYSFIAADLISVQELDLQLAGLMERGKLQYISFAVSLIRELVLSERKLCLYTDFIHCLECFYRFSQKGRAIEGSDQLMKDIKESTAIFKVQQLLLKDPGNDNEMRGYLTELFHEWLKICYHPGSSEKTQTTFIIQEGLMKLESATPLFFRIFCELAVESFAMSQTAESSYHAIDAFARIVVLLVIHSGELASTDPNHARLNLTAKILSVIVLVLVHSHEQNQKVKFNQKPYYRLFSSLLNEFHSFKSELEPIYIQILSAMSNTFHTLQPKFLPGFTFAWVQLISHRNFMPHLLLENQKFWPFYQRLLVDLFKYLAPSLQAIKLSNPCRILYQATLRLMLVLLHDFPEFLSDYHFSFVDVLPHSCIQLRNLILSAFPRHMRLPDPFTPNLKVDLLPEINQAPRILSDYTSSILSNNLKQDVDQYLKSKSPVTFLNDLKNRLMVNGNSASDTVYNVPAINSLVLYLGIQAIGQSQTKLIPSASPGISNIPMDIFQHLALDLDNEGRYFFFSAIANQLRYSNSHTHYFSVVLLHLFEDAVKPIIQEQITRVLVERLIVNRPHPYGLLITFIELIRNPRYKFWDHSFISGAPELERLFQNVAKSINSSIPRNQ